MELLFYWTISQILLVALGVLGIIIVNFLKGGLHRYEKAISYYELVWTALPTLILCSIAGPRMVLLYTHEMEGEERLSIKCVGHQWYWRLEYRDLEDVVFERFIVPSEDLLLGESRLLEVDNRIVVPVNTRIQLLVTREDVIHSFALPSLGVKVDGTPGRLNSVSLYLPSVGVLYGQCRELCGVNHSLIPVVAEVTLPILLVEWLKRV